MSAISVFIPTVGTRLVLSKPWSFHLHDERRNEKFYISAHGEIKRTDYHWAGFNGKRSPVKTNECWHQSYTSPEPLLTTIPKGAVLEVDRIYIRRGAGNFDSVSFRLISGMGKVKGRFWAKLTEINGSLTAEVAEKENKYPNGKFILTSGEWSGGEVTIKGLHWRKNPANYGSYAGFSVQHEKRTNGFEQITTEKHCYAHTNRYNKDFASLEDLLDWARRKEFSEDHIKAFIKAYFQKIGKK